MIEFIALVDKEDNEIGSIEKMEAHRLGLLHRAFSVFVKNTKGEILLQQRALDKYHSGGLWTNTCCSHPRINESVLDAAKRRLPEEMGLTCDLHQLYSFIYRAELDNDLIEHELDHVLLGYSDTEPTPNPEEVMNYKYLSPDLILLELKENPASYTVWFKIIFEDAFDLLRG